MLGSLLEMAFSGLQTVTIGLQSPAAQEVLGISLSLKMAKSWLMQEISYGDVQE